jgi:hypothetical protein
MIQYIAMRMASLPRVLIRNTAIIASGSAFVFSGAELTANQPLPEVTAARALAAEKVSCLIHLHETPRWVRSLPDDCVPALHLIPEYGQGQGERLKTRLLDGQIEWQLPAATGLRQEYQRVEDDIQEMVGEDARSTMTGGLVAWIIIMSFGNAIHRRRQTARR